MRRRISVLCVLVILSVSCTQKPNTDPSTLAVFNSISARLNRVAMIYCPAALDALPLVAATLKWDEAKANAVKGVVEKIKASALSGRQTLGKIADSAISQSQKLVIGPLLTAIGEGLDELEALGLFDSIENTKIETGLRLAALALKQIGRLLPRQV